MSPVLRSSRAGFTLAEMMAVIVIIGLLSTIVVPSVMHDLSLGQNSKVKADITAITHALNGFALNNAGHFPDTLEPLVRLDSNGHRYLERSQIPKDPWDSEYGYEPPVPGRTEPRVFTLGKDHVPGGEGDDADIDNFVIRDGAR